MTMTTSLTSDLSRVSRQCSNIVFFPHGRRSLFFPIRFDSPAPRRIAEIILYISTNLPVTSRKFIIAYFNLYIFSLPCQDFDERSLENDLIFLCIPGPFKNLDTSRQKKKGGVLNSMRHKGRLFRKMGLRSKRHLPFLVNFSDAFSG